ncbi:MAG: type II secretion system protein J [Planctomycetota bacterium]
MKTCPQRKTGFTLAEVAIAMLLIILVGASAAASLRMSLRTLTGTEMVALATSAVREYRELTFDKTIEEMDLLDGTQTPPVLADGGPMPDAINLLLDIGVTPVDDNDPTIEVKPAESRTRKVKVVVTSAGKQILEARWITAEH